MDDKTLSRGPLGNSILLAVLIIGAQPGIAATPDGSLNGTKEAAHLTEAYGRLPLSFEANAGQTRSEVKFLSRGLGYTLFLTRRAEAVLVLSKPATNRDRARPAHKPSDVTGSQRETAPAAVLRMRLVGSRGTSHIEGTEELPGKANYFIGNDPKHWRTNVPAYAKVRARAVYPGVDLVYYGNRRQLEHDFVVAPGADPSSIRIAFEGTKRLYIDEHGDLLLAMNEGAVRLQKPAAYQERDGMQQVVPSRFKLDSRHQVSFRVGTYDRSRELIIDPVLAYSTYLGGSQYDEGDGIAVDGAGNAYVTGSTYSIDFPTAHPLQSTNGAAGGGRNVFVGKLNSAGSALLYSTYLGGSQDDVGSAIAVDSAGNAYVTGATYSTDFPTANPFQPAKGGVDTSNSNAFVAELDSSGSNLLYSTYLGGSQHDAGVAGKGQGDAGSGIAVDSAGNVYLTGYAQSPDFPTANPLQATYGGSQDAFVAKLDSSGSTLLFSTYLGGNGVEYGNGIAVDSAGNVFVTGSTSSANFPTANALQPANGGVCGNSGCPDDAFVAKLDSSGSTLLYSTYLGGSQYDEADGIAVDTAGNAYVTGATASSNFPTANALQPTYSGACGPMGGCNPIAFVAKLDPAGSVLLYSTYLGGSGSDVGRGIAVDSGGSAYVAGETLSNDFPTANPLQPNKGGNGQVANRDAFIVKLNPAGSALIYSTYLGGSSDDGVYSIALDSAGNAYVTGSTYSTDFPTANPLQPANGGNADAFVAKIIN